MQVAAAPPRKIALSLRDTWPPAVRVKRSLLNKVIEANKKKIMFMKVVLTELNKNIDILLSPPRRIQSVGDRQMFKKQVHTIPKTVANKN